MRYEERARREANMDSERKIWIEEEMEGGLDDGCEREREGEREREIVDEGCAHVFKIERVGER